MIVISGALVLVALVLLVLGLTMQDLNFVYGSIGVSLVSFVFLVIGILQRRGDTPQPAAAGGPDVREDGAAAKAPAQEPAPAEPVAVPVARSSSRRVSAPVVEEEYDDAPEMDEDEEIGGTVLVVPGRPRYHVEGCRYLTGKEVDEVDVLDAREDGFTACGVCKPDDALADVETPAVGLVPAVAAVEEPDVEESDVQEPEPEPEPQPAPLPSRRAAAKKASSVRAPRETAVVERPAKKAPARAAKAAPAAPVAAEPDPLEQVAAGRGAKASRTSPAKAAPAPAAKKAPAKAPAKAAKAAEPAPAAPTATRRTGTVVVIPERGRFHKADCRYVRGVDEAEVLTKAQATKQGFEACGVCKP